MLSPISSGICQFGKKYLNKKAFSDRQFNTATKILYNFSKRGVRKGGEKKKLNLTFEEFITALIFIFLPPVFDESKKKREGKDKKKTF